MVFNKNLDWGIQEWANAQLCAYQVSHWYRLLVAWVVAKAIPFEKVEGII